MGKILGVDLSSKRIYEEPAKPDDAKLFLGGRGLAGMLLFKRLKPKINPLSSENVLIFMTTPLNGTKAPSFVKFNVETKSPLSNTILMTLAGGYFAAELKAAGYDGIIIEGKAEEPSYIWIKNGSVKICDAKHLWGMLTEDAQQLIKDETECDAEICCIGPAGEKLVKYASIISGVRACGRGGAGAVMGSKNLKAIAVKGEARVEVANPEKFDQAVNKIMDAYRKSERLFKVFGKYATPGVIPLVNERGIFPTRNYQTGVFEAADTTINPEYHQKLVVKKYTCYKCPVACGNVTLVREGPYAGYMTVGPEYESTWAFGPQCGNSCFEAIVAAERLCDSLGLDVISTGNCVGFAMECYEKGLISKDMADGLELKFGNHEAMVQMIRKIGFRQGFGNLLAEGVKEASKKIPGSEKFAMHVKGLETAGYDARGAKGMGLTYATGPRGGCHERSLIVQETFGRPPPVDRFKIEGKAELVKETQIEMTVLDSIGLCVFPAHNANISMEILSELYSAATGIEMSAEEMLKAGERILTLERLFNVREGFTAKDDTLPERMLKEPMPEGPSKGHIVELETMLKEYYEVMGWDENGKPKDEKLSQLNLENFKIW
jgi:aldehyde:ferredoxin oxidoreductase